jgi:NHLM bacteriocin system ABC transporter ATP-binding protein
MGSIAETAEQPEVRYTPKPNALFSLHDAGTIWIVESGRLDIYLVNAHDNEPTGARFHLLRVSQGEAVFGFGLSAPHLVVSASAAPGTQLTKLSKQRFCEQLETSASRSRFTSLLEDWILRLGAAVSTGLPPGPFLVIKNDGQPISIADEARALIPEQDLLWVAHQRGSSSFLGYSHAHAVNGNGFFPLTRAAWLQAAPGSSISSVDSATFLKLDEQWSGLANFHSIVLQFLAIKHQELTSKEQRRLKARIASDDALVDSSLRRLALPIRRTSAFMDDLGACRDPIFLATEAIGKYLRIQVKPAPEMLRNVPLADPIDGIARASGMRVRRISLKDNWWDLNTTPLLVFREEDEHPLALIPGRLRGFQVHDPVGHRQYAFTKAIADSLKPLGYVLYRPLPPKPLRLLQLVKHSLPECKAELLTVAITGIVSGLLGVVIPIATGVIFDRLIPAAQVTQLVQTAVFLFLVSVSMSLVNFVGSFAALRLQGKADATLQAAIWDRLLSLPVSFFREYGAGELGQRSLGISTIQQILTGSTLNAMLTGIFSIFSFLLLFYYSWKLALVATALVAVAFTMTVVCGLLGLRKQRQLIVLQAKISSILLQLINGVAKFRVSATEKRAFSAWARHFSKQKQLATDARRISNALGVFNSSFPLACSGVIFYCYEAQLSSANALPMRTGEFLAFLAAFTQFLMVALALGSVAVQSLSIIPIYEMAKPILDATPEQALASAHPGTLSGAIEISHVNFRYKADGPLILRDVTVSIRPGEFIVFVGASGSGKSTLLRLLLGFESPESGAIYYDNHDLASLDVQAVRRQLGVVLQSSRPINGSILKNITGSAPLTIQDAWDAAHMAGFDEDIKKMPMGIHTHVSDGGGNISGGQKQRLMIARAIVGRPRILIFDEATSALDNQTQAVVSRSLESLQATRIVIAHRLSTIMHADRIYVMQKGTIVQSGTYDELVQQPGQFELLAKRQMI